jgi:hypothetical protein
VFLSLLSAASLAAAPVSGPCPHPYFPLEEGLALTYRAGRQEFVLSVKEVQRAAESMTFTLQIQNGERIATTTGECGADGIKTELGGLEGLILKSAGLDAEVTQSEGVAMPPPAQMKIGGAPWSNKIALKMKLPEKAGKMASGMTIQTAFAKEAQVVGEEEASTAAGKFKSLKVLNKTTASNGSMGGDRAMESFMWIAPRFGIIKFQTGDSVDLELVRVDESKVKKAPPPPKPGKKAAKRD